MGRFDHLATRPIRGPADILRWKVVDAIAGRNRKDPGGDALWILDVGETRALAR